MTGEMLTKDEFYDSLWNVPDEDIPFVIQQIAVEWAYFMGEKP